MVQHCQHDDAEPYLQLLLRVVRLVAPESDDATNRDCRVLRGYSREKRGFPFAGRGNLAEFVTQG